MIRGLYTAYTGMLNQQHRLDTITNNLANAATTGYKREGVTSKSFKEMVTLKVKDITEPFYARNIGTMSLGVKIGENYTDYKSGSFRQTENTYDLAIENNGFFSILFTSKNGTESVKYTRDGEFTTDVGGYLRTKDGDYVLGEGGIINIPTNSSDIAVNELGEIYADGVYVDKLAIADFEDYDYLKKYGENMYDAVDGAVAKEPDAGTRIRQGYLESSNINVVSEMVEMITISRQYESNQKVIQTMDTMLDKSVNEIGKI